jgi:acetoin utilization protein AcuB
VTGTANVEPLVADAMTHDPVTIVPDTPLESAAELMSRRKIGALPVVRDGKLVGLITESDLFRAFAAMLAPGGHGARITFDITAGEDIYSAMYELTGQYGMRITNLFTFADGKRRLCVVQVLGWDVDRLIEAVWRKHHRVVSVLRFGSPMQETPSGDVAQDGEGIQRD